MAVDLRPHPLVQQVAEALFNKEALAEGATPTPDDVLAAFAGDDKAPELIAFAGFLGPAVEHDGDPWRLLYLDWRLRGWLLVDESAIYVRLRVKDDAAPEGKRDVLYVDARGSVGRGTGPQT